MYVYSETLDFETISLFLHWRKYTKLVQIETVIPHLRMILLVNLNNISRVSTVQKRQRVLVISGFVSVWSRNHTKIWINLHLSLVSWQWVMTKYYIEGYNITLVSFSRTHFPKSGFQVVKYIFCLNGDYNRNNYEEECCTVEHL